MVIAQILNFDTAKELLESALYLSKQLKKDFVILSFVQNDSLIEPLENKLKKSIINTKIIVVNSNTKSVDDICTELEASFLFIQLTDNKFIKSLLNDCRELRIPYILFKNSFSILKLEKVLLPIGFLIEEIEKTQFASAFGRFLNSEIIMLLANDYGSKAITNANKMKELFDRFNLNYRLNKATEDSFNLEFEAIKVAERETAGLILISASREYGLDDLIFGPKEYKVIKKSNTPVLIINPRADLYALCD